MSTAYAQSSKIGKMYVDTMYKPDENVHYSGTVTVISRVNADERILPRDKLKFFSIYGKLGESSMPSDGGRIMLPEGLDFATFEHIMTFVDHYYTDTPENKSQVIDMIYQTPLPTDDFLTLVDAWYVSFFNSFDIAGEPLKNVYSCSNDLGCDVLKYCCAAYYAVRFKLKTPAEICALMRVPPPTHEQVQQIKEMMKRYEHLNPANIVNASKSEAGKALAEITENAAQDIGSSMDQLVSNVGNEENEDDLLQKLDNIN